MLEKQKAVCVVSEERQSITLEVRCMLKLKTNFKDFRTIIEN